jgi:hypothetical protein
MNYTDLGLGLLPNLLGELSILFRLLCKYFYFTYPWRGASGRGRTQIFAGLGQFYLVKRKGGPQVASGHPRKVVQQPGTQTPTGAAPLKNRWENVHSPHR